MDFPQVKERYKGKLTRDLLTGILASTIFGSIAIDAISRNQTLCVDKPEWKEPKRVVVECHNSKDNIILQGVDTIPREMPSWVQWDFVDTQNKVYIYFEHGPVMQVAKIDLKTGELSDFGEFYIDK